MTEDKVGVPRGAQRRQKRSERRQHQRRAQRRQTLRSVLNKAGWLPEKAEETETLFSVNPYPLWARATTDKLTLAELSRVFYRFAARRGYKSAKKTDEHDLEKEKESTKTEEGIKTFQSELKSRGMTLGQFLAQYMPKDGDKEAHTNHNKKTQWVRNHGKLGTDSHRSISRQMYLDDFEKIWAFQKTFHADALNDDLKEKLFHALFNQRRTWWPADTVGKCRLTTELNCPKSHWFGQQFRMLQEINNLKVVDQETGEERFLESKERIKLAAALLPVKSITFKEMAKMLWPKKKMAFMKFEENAKRSGLSGNLVEAALRSEALASWYGGLSKEDKEKLHDAIAATEEVEFTFKTRVRGKIKTRKQRRVYGGSTDMLRKAAIALGATADQSQELTRAAESLPDGYFEYSASAIRRLIPHLENGLTIDKAVASEFAPTSGQEPADYLPPVIKFDPYLTNPLVHRALSEARKVVNAIIREHGKPNEIVIELARQMKQSRKERTRDLKENKTRERINDEARSEIESAGQPITRENIRRYKLWKEYRDNCKDPCFCPYCRSDNPAVISSAVLFTPEIEIDHILPRSRSCDDSFNNLILCCVKCNQEKGNRTPMEAWGHDQQRWETNLHRIDKLPEPKRRRFKVELTADTARDHLFEDRVGRILNDTRYLSRRARSYMETLGCKVRCVSSGRMTYELRHYWSLNGLNGVGPSDEKNRTDHRHHAIDAVIIALTTYKHIHNLANRYKDRNLDFPPPWQGFRDDVQKVVDEIGDGKVVGVSFKPAQTINAGLHNETFYGIAKDRYGKEIKNGKKLVLVTRKKIEDLTPAIIKGDGVSSGICDSAIRSIIQEECRKRKIPLTGTKKVGPTLSDPPPQMKSGVPIKRVRIYAPSTTAQFIPARHAGAKKGPRPARFVLPGGNHHVEILEGKNAKGELTWTGRAVSTFQANSRLSKVQPVIDRSTADGARFVMSLHNNDMVTLADPKTNQRKLYRVQKMSITDRGSPYICFRLHTAARIEDDAELCRVQSWDTFISLRPQKVTVDPLGRIYPCND